MIIWNIFVQNYTSNGSLPVMVFFHGGAFHFGSSNSDLYGPQRLLDYEVILVTSNYRLGPLGFLSTGTLDCPGNNGLKDQVQVLKWVGENIGAFGGSPDKVTIFGQSAGAASVTYHLISKKAEGKILNFWFPRSQSITHSNNISEIYLKWQRVILMFHLHFQVSFRRL